MEIPQHSCTGMIFTAMWLQSVYVYIYIHIYKTHSSEIVAGFVSEIVSVKLSGVFKVPFWLTNAVQHWLSSPWCTWGASPVQEGLFLDPAIPFWLFGQFFAFLPAVLVSSAWYGQCRGCVQRNPHRAAGSKGKRREGKVTTICLR